MKRLLFLFALCLSLNVFSDQPVPVKPVDPAGPYECWGMARCHYGAVSCYSVKPEDGGWYCKAREYPGYGVECWTWDIDKQLIKHQFRRCG